MIREQHTFTSPESLAAYLLAETGEPAEFVTETITIATRDGVVALDNCKVFGIKGWEITYDDGIFQVQYESGNLNAEGEIILDNAPWAALYRPLRLGRLAGNHVRMTIV